MTDGNQTPVEQSEQSFAYQQETPNPVQEAVQATEQSITASATEMNLANERAAFETYVQNSGETIPENFQDAGAWFDSLKEAQKQYTQARQEISDLKTHYNEEGTVNPNANEATPEPVQEQTSELTDSSNNPELRIPPKPQEEPQAEADLNQNMTQKDWDDWGYEVAATGKLSEETRYDITQKTGFTDAMINDFLAGQKAKMRESYSAAAEVVGSTEKLQSMLKWASENMSEEEQFAINSGMAQPTMRDITLRGLASKYDAVLASRPSTDNEPKVIENRVNTSATVQNLTGYTTKREFTMDRNNPRFNMEPQFRQAVEERMTKTDWNSLPE